MKEHQHLSHPQLAVKSKSMDRIPECHLISLVHYLSEEKS